MVGTPGFDDRRDMAMQEVTPGDTQMVLGSCDSTRVVESSHGLQQAYELAVQYNKDFAVVVTKTDDEKASPTDAVEESIRRIITQVQENRGLPTRMPDIIHTSAFIPDTIGAFIDKITQARFMATLMGTDAPQP